MFFARVCASWASRPSSRWHPSTQAISFASATESPSRDFVLVPLCTDSTFRAACAKSRNNGKFLLCQCRSLCRCLNSEFRRASIATVAVVTLRFCCSTQNTWFPTFSSTRKHVFLFLKTLAGFLSLSNGPTSFSSVLANDSARS